MSGNQNLRAVALMVPVVAAAAIAVSVVAMVDSTVQRVALEIAAVLCTVAAVFRAAELGLREEPADAATGASTLKVVARDHRRPIFDRESGAYSAWYFRLRVEEEIARAERFGERFSVVSISGTATTPLDVGAIATKHWLRDVDFAGNLGTNLAVALPKTDRRGAQIFVERMRPTLETLDVRISEYPADGKTLDSLLGEDEWRSSEPSMDAAA